MEAADARAVESMRDQNAWLELLVSRGALSASDASQMTAIQRESRQPLASIALRLGKVSERALAEAMSEVSGLPMVAAEDFPVEAVAAGNVLPVFWRTHELAPLSLAEGCLTIASWDVSNRKPIEALAFSTRLRILEKVATRAAIITAPEFLKR